MDSDIILGIIIGGGSVLVIIACVLWAFLSTRHQIKNYDPEKVKTPEPVVKRAEVTHKYIDTQITGSYRYPSRRLIYQVVFKT